MKHFWQEIEDQLNRCQAAETVDEVLAIFPPVSGTSSGDGWFGGSGGDDQVIDALLSGNGWTIVRYVAPYYWVAQDKNGDRLSYTEGDLGRGDNPSCE